jgi:hypothetical protein
METIVKIDIVKLKDVIKESAEKQKFYKNQRKTVHIVGERKMPAEEAEEKHRWTRDKLRCMYAAYGLARGKSFSQTENHYPEENHPLKSFHYQQWINKFLDVYKIKDEK